jgi:hypothetical protein
VSCWYSNGSSHGKLNSDEAKNLVNHPGKPRIRAGGENRETHDAVSKEKAENGKSTTVILARMDNS